MNNLKEFLDRKYFTCLEEMSERIDYQGCRDNAVYLTDLGMFFWLRGGKQFVFDIEWNTISLDCSIDKKLKIMIADAKSFLSFKENMRDNSIREKAQDFLDCLACLGEEKVKELIEKEGEVKTK